MRVVSPRSKQVTRSHGNDRRPSLVAEEQASAPRTQRPIGRCNAWSRAAALKSLERLERGRLTLVDDLGRFEFGSDRESELQATIEVLDPRTYRHLFFGGNLGAAEAFLRGYWTCDQLVSALRVMTRNESVMSQLDGGWSRIMSPLRRLENLLRRNTHSGSRRNIAAHYDLNNDFFAQFLDRTMAYSCGIFESSDATMEQASLAKFELVCRKLKISPGDNVLEIGSGWGGFAIYAAKQFGCRVTTVTVSKQQYNYGRQRILAEGLSGKVTLLLRDYRDLTGQYDKLVSIEMIEAVGHEFLPTYFGRCDQLLKPGGAFLLQSITMPDERYDRYRKSTDFVRRYIFPGGCVPSLGALATATERATQLQLVDTEDFAGHYARTLEVWRERFFAQIDTIRALGFTERLIRAWNYYLCYCEAGFRERRIGLAHLLFEKPCGEPSC